MTNKDWRKWSAAAASLSAAAALLLSACSSEQADEPVPSQPLVAESTAPDIAPGPSASAPAGAYTSPLTGLPAEEAVNLRPVAVMINNAPAARPQSGLQDADVVYEVLAEGGITRLVAIFQSADSGSAKLGPVRSIRPYLIELGESYHGVLAHAGGSPDAYSILQSQHKEELDEIGRAGAYFWRDSARKAPHNLYTSLEKLREGVDKFGFAAEDNDVPSYTFRQADEPLTEGEAAAGVQVTFLQDSYKVSYRYDAGTQLYTRYIGDKAHVDKETGEPLTMSNVIVMGADHKVLDDVGRLSVDLAGGGKALLLQRGRVLTGQWVHKKDDVIRFVKDGAEVPLYPGKTYFNIVPNSPDFDSHIQILEDL
ncbi:hypothetical protein AWM70_00140 [Paenibacillus yonginensis]|uniref:Lipoprotein YerB n=1 Tax=Paenibacillus yonginensis TaxID=1462996 RepID=A0A1B1MVI5_9BACL|nr:DUF3048 domain-containing protein [Paenibacillus yonginensis]ANS73188.1 hypothetical protein AWM70_00140 [Paenibacillus yonginensis]